MAAEDWLPSDVEFEPLRDAMDRIALEMQQRPIRYIYLYRNRPRPLQTPEQWRERVRSRRMYLTETVAGRVRP